MLGLCDSICFSKYAMSTTGHNILPTYTNNTATIVYIYILQKQHRFISIPPTYSVRNQVAVKEAYVGTFTEVKLFLTFPESKSDFTDIRAECSCQQHSEFN